LGAWGDSAADDRGASDWVDDDAWGSGAGGRGDGGFLQREDDRYTWTAAGGSCYYYKCRAAQDARSAGASV